MQILPSLNTVPCISRSGCNPEKKILLFPEMLQTLIANNACEERKCTQIFHMRYASYLYEDIRQSFVKKSHSTKQTPNSTPNVSLSPATACRRWELMHPMPHCCQQMHFISHYSSLAQVLVWTTDTITIRCGWSPRLLLTLRQCPCELPLFPVLDAATWFCRQHARAGTTAAAKHLPRRKADCGVAAGEL